MSIITTSSIFKLVGIVRSLMAESPLKKIARQELEAAIREINNLGIESTPKDCLNRTLVHLESAFTHYEPSTWKFFEDETAVLWDQRTYKNTICITIAIIHYSLGNNLRAKVWLSEELSTYGSIEMPKGSLDMLNIDKEGDFFNLIFNDNGKTYLDFLDTIVRHHNQEYDSWNPLYASDYPYP